MIELRAIDENNFIDAFNLKLAKGQKEFVSHPVRSLAQAYVYRKQCQPFGIYAGEEMAIERKLLAKCLNTSKQSLSAPCNLTDNRPAIQLSFRVPTFLDCCNCYKLELKKPNAEPKKSQTWK